VIAYELKKEWKPADVKRHIIENNIYGADIDKDAVEISRLRLWLTVVADEENPDLLADLNYKMVAGDSLDPEVLKPFITDGGFDIVIANPPYIGQKGNKALFAPLSNDPDFETKMDYWYFFLHRSYALTKKGGVNTFITPNYWVTARGAKKIRKRITENYRMVGYINFNDNEIFDAGIHTNIFILKKDEAPNRNIKCTIYQNKYSENILKHRDNELNFYADQNKILSAWTGFIHFLPADVAAMIEAMTIGCEKLSDDESEGAAVKGIIPGKKVTNGICSISPGIESGKDKGIFVLTKAEVDALNLTDEEKQFVKRFYKNSDIDKYVVSDNSDSYFLYINSIESEEEFATYKNLYTHFLKHKSELAVRATNGVLESAYKRGKWWALKTDRPTINWSLQKIVCPQRSKENKFALADESFLSSVDVYYISTNKSEYDLRYILAILNSRLMHTWLYWMGKRKGEMLELYFEPLQFIPIKKISVEEQKPFVMMIEQIINLKNKSMGETHESVISHFEKLDKLVYDLYLAGFLEEKE
jgi:adenine-specific DNA-methyltransferase